LGHCRMGVVWCGDPVLPQKAQNAQKGMEHEVRFVCFVPLVAEDLAEEDWSYPDSSDTKG